MARTFLKFDGKTVLINELKWIEKTQDYSIENPSEPGWVFRIEINRPTEEGAQVLQYFKFEYKTEELRDEKWLELHQLLEMFEHIVFIEF